MKRFAPPPEPPDFDAQARQPGKEWLSQNLDENGKLPRVSAPRTGGVTLRSNWPPDLAICVPTR